MRLLLHTGNIFGQWVLQHSKCECGSVWHTNESHIHTKVRMRECYEMRHFEHAWHGQEVFECVLSTCFQAQSCVWRAYQSHILHELRDTGRNFPATEHKTLWYFCIVVSSVSVVTGKVLCLCAFFLSLRNKSNKYTTLPPPTRICLWSGLCFVER